MGDYSGFFGEVHTELPETEGLENQKTGPLFLAEAGWFRRNLRGGFRQPPR